jgi:glucokinase
MGTGLGAGLIFNDHLYMGASGMAGEVGHWRLASEGPEGYGKAGSFEGFCSGGGIAKWAKALAIDAVHQGRPIGYALNLNDVDKLSAATLADAADAGTESAAELWHEIGTKLGVGLSLIIDLVNPDVIVIGGIFERQQSRLVEPMSDVILRETLDATRNACRVVPSGLGALIGDYSGLAVALVGDMNFPAGRQLTAAVLG